MRCHALREYLCKPEDKERYISHAPELRTEGLDPCIESLCRCVGRTVVKVAQDYLVIVHGHLPNSVKALQLHLVHPVIPSCQFGHQCGPVVYLQKPPHLFSIEAHIVEIAYFLALVKNI